MNFIWCIQKVGICFSTTVLFMQLSGPEFTSKANNENIDSMHEAGSFPDGAIMSPWRCENVWKRLHVACSDSAESLNSWAPPPWGKNKANLGCVWPASTCCCCLSAMDGASQQAAVLCVSKVALSLLFLPSLAASNSPVSFCCCCILLFTDLVVSGEKQDVNMCRKSSPTPVTYQMCLVLKDWLGLTSGWLMHF